MTNTQIYALFAAFVIVQAELSFRKRWQMPRFRGDCWFFSVQTPGPASTTAKAGGCSAATACGHLRLTLSKRRGSSQSCCSDR